MAILSADRTIDWSYAGVWKDGVHGIPTYPVGVDLTGLSSYGGHTLDNTGVNDSTAAIQDAITDCSVGYAVYVPAGTYYISGALDVSKGIVIRGESGASGEPLTVFHQHASVSTGTIYIHGSYVGNPPYISGVNITGSYSKGDTVLTVASTSGVTTNRVIGIDQLNSAYMRTYNNSGTWCGRGGSGERLLLQNRIVTGVTSNTITISPGLDFPLDSAQSPQYYYADMSSAVYNAGIEYIKFTFVSGLSTGWAGKFRAAVWCWAKNCEVVSSPRMGFRFEYRCFGGEVRRCYIHGSPNVGGDQGYGVMLYWGTDYCLIEDNIFEDLHLATNTEAMCSSNVFAYNYAESNHYYNQPWMLGNYYHHAPHPYMNLHEGNYGNEWDQDFYFGSGSHQLVVRCVFDMKNPKYQDQVVESIAAIQNEGYHWYSSFLGNVLGHATLSTTYPSPTFTISYSQTPSLAGGFWYDMDYHPTVWMHGETYGGGVDFDDETENTAIIHGNFDYVTNTVIWDGDIADHDIPDSYLHTNKPTWFGNLNWPAIGPDVSGYLSNTPAKLRWDNYGVSADIGDIFADAPSYSPTFTLAIVPTTRTVSAGATASYLVTVNADDGFTDNVTLSVSGLPVGTSPSFVDNPVAPDATTTMSIDTTGFSPATLSLKVNGEVV